MNADDLKETLGKQDYRRLFDRLGFDLSEGRENGVKIYDLYRPGYLGEDKNPSVEISLTKGTYQDYGSKHSGDIFTLAQKAHDLNFPQAIDWVAEQVSQDLLEDIDGANMEDDLPPIDIEEVKGYCNQLLQSDQTIAQNTREYLAGRIQLETVKEFRIGIQGEDQWRLFIPLKDEGGEVTNYKRILLEPDGGWALDADGNKFISTRGSPVLYPKHKLRSKSQAILCEGELDALSLVENGLNGITVGGAMNFKNEHAEELRRFVNGCVLAMDGDTTGREATKKAARILNKYDLEARDARLPEGEDVNSLYQKEGIDYLIDLFRRAEKIEPEPVEESQDIEEFDVDKLLMVLEHKWKRLSDKDRRMALRKINRLVSREGFSLNKVM